VVTYHCDIVRQAWALRVYGPVLHRFLRRADRIIVTSQPYLESSEFLREVRDKCVIVPLGIDTAAIDPARADRERVEALRARYGREFILFVGKLRYYKGLDY